MSAGAQRLLASSAVALALAGCTHVGPALQPKPWDMYGGAGQLRVYGAPRTAPGPRIFRALQREPTLARLLDEQGEPDSVEVIGDRLDPKRVVLTYRRDDAAPPRRIVLEPTRQGYVAGAPEVRRTERVVRREEIPAPQQHETAAPCKDCAPTAMQRLECPIDRRRSECRAFCVPGASYEWCH